MMAQQTAAVHLGPVARNRFAARSSAGAIYSVGVWIVVAIVVVAVVWLILAGRDGRQAVGASVVGVSDLGLHLADADSASGGFPEDDLADDPVAGSNGQALDRGANVVPWDSVFEIVVITRRELRTTWFGFEIRTEGHGLVKLDGSRGPGQEFLAECHRFAGFNHDELGAALTRRRSQVICYSR